MRLKMSEKRAITKEVARRYQKVMKKQKSLILDEFTVITGYNRDYASHILHNWGKKVYMEVKGRTVAVIFGILRRRKKRQSRRVYDEKVIRVVKSLWELSPEHVRGFLSQNIYTALLRQN